MTGMALEDGATFRVPEAVHTRRFGSELILLELSGGEYFSLDEIGARIWEALAAGRPLREVVTSMASEYEVSPDRFRADICTLTEELLSRKLLVATSGIREAEFERRR